MNILVRLPNWLGDLVMSSAFVGALHKAYPDARIDVITKKGIDDIARLIPNVNKVFPFSKHTGKGIRGAYYFGKQLRGANYDLFFSLPDSTSASIMGLGTKSKKRIGYNKEVRKLFLTNSYNKPKGLHRAEEYVKLLELHTNQAFDTEVKLNTPTEDPVAGLPKEYITVNFNSEAQSRRMPINKAQNIINAILNDTDLPIILIGGPDDTNHVNSIISDIKSDRIQSVAGKTSLVELISILANAEVVLTTDSGPAHLANSLGTQTIVLFGAGDDSNTAPYNVANRTILRADKIECAPCLSNTCKLGTPICLTQIEEKLIVNKVKALCKN